MQDFLRQNNTGKLLLQVFGVEVTTLCLYGILEHEEIMWNAFKSAGTSMPCVSFNKTITLFYCSKNYLQYLTLELRN